MGCFSQRDPTIHTVAIHLVATDESEVDSA